MNETELLQEIVAYLAAIRWLSFCILVAMGALIGAVIGTGGHK